tara:strand:+ start:1104 stop:1445 length:342 start_codon:yes stop_codon:yes gene_type:complete
MRKIESDMNTAIRNRSDFRSSNTTVENAFNTDTNQMEAVVKLHGNHIATVTNNALVLFDGGWQSNTTKSRLNALINEFTDGTKNGVFQKNWSWFVTSNGATSDFVDGVQLAIA